MSQIFAISTLHHQTKCSNRLCQKWGQVHFVTILQSTFLAGEVWPVLLRGLSRHRAAALSQEVGLMRLIIQRVLALTVKELLALLRDAASRAVLIGPPIIQLLVFGYAATFDLKHVPFVVYNQDQGRLSRDFIARFEGSPSFSLLRVVHNQNELGQAIDDKSVLMAMDIGPASAAS